LTRAPLRKLRASLRALRASITGLREAIPGSRYQDLLHLELHRLEKSAEELARRIGAEREALDEPHAFLRPRFGIWCLRCGGTRDREELHPPELQQTNHEGAALAAGGSRT
jgi:hypothetical protein